MNKSIPQQMEKAPPAPGASGGARRTLLVVDDEASARSLLQETLEEAGYAVVTASSGAEALEIVSTREFDAVLLDIRMPGLSGLAVLQEVQDRYPDTPAIMLTAVGDAETAVGAMKAGAYDYVVKPFRLADVVVRVGKAIEKRGLLQANRKYQDQLEQMVKEQGDRLQNQFAQLVQSLAREHAAILALQGARGSKEAEAALANLPSELQKPAGSVEDFAKALLQVIRRRDIPSGS